MLIQFQCDKEGTVFYYQHPQIQYARAMVRHCPVCGSKRVSPTGRQYPAVDQAQREGE